METCESSWPSLTTSPPFLPPNSTSSAAVLFLYCMDRWSGVALTLPSASHSVTVLVRWDVVLCCCVAAAVEVGLLYLLPRSLHCMKRGQRSLCCAVVVGCYSVECILPSPVIHLSPSSHCCFAVSRPLSLSFVDLIRPPLPTTHPLVSTLPAAHTQHSVSTIQFRCNTPCVRW